MEGDAPRRTWPLKATLVVLTAGLYFAGYLAYLKLKITFPDPDFVSFCKLGDGFDCDEVQRHASSMLFGVPIALLAIPTYLVMGWLAWTGLRRREGSGVAVSYLAGLGLLTVGYAAWLAWVSKVEIGTWCLFCMGMYVVQLLVTVFAFAARGVSFREVLAEIAGALPKLRGPVLGAAGVFLVSFGIAWWVWSGAYDALAADERARIEAELAELAVPATPAAEASATTAAAPSGATPATAEPAATKPAPPREPKLTDNGYDWFDIPVDETDAALGSPDAPVTYVSFKDFECGFCRFVANQEAPLKKKYAESGEVRFVFKHYPMNADCNYRMGSTRMHDGACRAAYASVCAAEQGRFWEMHDELYANTKKFSDEQIRGYAQRVGLDVTEFDACYRSDRPKKKVEADVRLAARMRIIGTPRIYVANRLVTGSTATDVLDYYIQMGKQAAEAGTVPQAAPAQPATEASPRMISMRKASGEFWIDAFEASIDKHGKAVSVPGVKPAMASWYGARAACEKAGKRMCTEEEWVSACIGEPAVDHGGNGNWTSGPVIGRMYPYGAFYDQGACRDSEDKLTGQADATGAQAGCRTREGAYDLAGNLYEWVGDQDGRATMMGGDYRSATGASCRKRTQTYGAGIKNDTTGFRCCTDAEVRDVATRADVTDTATPDVVGGGIPADLVLTTTEGGELGPQSFRGKVTYLTFFASWCGNCRKQMPAIKEWQDEWRAKGFQIVGVDVDRVEKKATDYIATLEPNFTVALDPSARTMSDFDINAMPTSFIIGRDGVIEKRVVGYKDEEIESTRRTILELLGR